jgi:HEAT repeat protein
VAIPAVVGALKDRDAGVRAEAALALINLGPAAKEAEPALEEASKDSDATVRGYAKKALERIRGG